MLPIQKSGAARLRQLLHRRSIQALAIVFSGATLTSGTALAQTGSFTELLSVEGDGETDELGSVLARAGDVNQDGFADLVVSSRRGATGPGSPSYVRVISGRNGATLHEWRGFDVQETEFGAALATAGDTSGDGVDDILVSSPNPDLSAPILGSVYLFSGSDGALLERWVEPNVNTDFGRAVAGVGDLDGDGLGDVAISAPMAGNLRGIVRVYSGATGTLVRTFTGVGGEGLGASVSGLGDFDGDATPDLLIGSPDGVPGSCPSCVRVYSGFDGAPLLTIVDTKEDSRLGAAVAAPGDVTGDGVPDIVASAPNASVTEPGDGAVYLFSGSDGSTVFRWTDGAGGPVPSGFGLHVDSGGDVDLDGTNDVVVGAPFAKGGATGLQRGRLFVYSGSDGSLLFRVTGQGDRHRFGTSAAIVGDANGDGFADVAAGAPTAITISPGGTSGGSERRSGLLRALSRVPENGGVLCIGVANSTGTPSTLSARSPSEFDTVANDIELEVTDLPPDVPGFFVVSPDFNVSPMAGGGAGTLCVASQNIGRILASFSVSSGSGDVGYALDNTQVPLPGGVIAVVPGDRLNFQFWHRDAGAAGSPTSNFSAAIAITFQ